MQTSFILIVLSASGGWKRPSAAARQTSAGTRYSSTGHAPEGIGQKTYRMNKFGSWERPLELDAQVGAAGQGEGIAFNFDKMLRTPNTISAHRVIWLSGDRAAQDALVEALLLAYFTDGLTCPTGRRSRGWRPGRV
jgi:predicted DsbA family dithiol-disulfide isomerase